VGAASRAALPAVLDALKTAQSRGLAVDELLNEYASRQSRAERFTQAYRRYCWPVHSLDDYRLAPFHLLATEGAVHAGKDHVWHLDNIREFCAADPGLLVATPYRVVDLGRDEERAAAVQWWLDLTARGGEGMVVKPLDYVTRGNKGLVQPAVKCRGPEYLRIIYGPEYDAPANLERLRQRGLAAKRSLALREFALGLEALERFVGGAPLRHVHECVFGVLALESEPLDPRL
jgi:protein phosphatase